jgi:hypothetical protein
MLFESLLANNVKFNSLEEIMTFIYNVRHEKPNRRYNDNAVLDRNITREECFYKLMTTVDQSIWIPEEEDLDIVWSYLANLDNTELNRIYYKNNLYSFCELPRVMHIIIKILKSLGGEPRCNYEETSDGKRKLKIDHNIFLNPNKPPKSIKGLLDQLTSFIKEYVYYPHFYTDKLDRVSYMQRDIVIITDTDSTIISFDAWYRFILQNIAGIDMPIKHELRNMVDVIKEDEFGDKPLREMVKYVEPEYDYDFNTDEVIELEHYINPVKLIPQDTLKYAILNTIAYICGDLVVDYLNEYSKLAGSYEEGVKCRLIMKNEFTFFRTLFLEAAKKNYSSITVLQEGNIIPEDQQFSITGMPINKSTMSNDIKSDLQAILLEDIMRADNIDQIAIMKKLIVIENKIYKSIMNKETKYYKPDSIGAMRSYKDPMRVNGIKASVIYNEIKDDNMPAINLEERNRIIKVKVDISKKNIDRIQNLYPETYKKILALLSSPIGKDLNTVALPLDVNIPDWLLAFVDVNSIINDSLKNFPLDSIGLSRLNNDSVNYSNIISL